MRFFTVVDEAHAGYGLELKNTCDILNEAIEEYISILNDVTAEVAKKGMTTDRYKQYASLISGLRGNFELLGTSLQTNATTYIKEMEDADSYLYQ